MTVINTNVGALQARTYAVRADSSVTKAMERLSSGLRINSAADDAAGLAVANKMESQIRGMNMAIRNSQDGISLVQTAEAAMGEINNMVIRMRELAVQMNNGVYTDADRANAQLEVTALLSEIDKVANNSAFNQVKILDGTYSQDIRAGNTNPEVINVTIDRMNTDSLGGGRVTAGVVNATATTNYFEESNTTIRVTEGRPTIADTELGLGIQNFASLMNSAVSAGGTGAAGTWSIKSSSTDDSAKFAINSSTGAITLNTDIANGGVAELNFDEGTDPDNTYNFTVQYTDSNGNHTVSDNITLEVTNLDVLTGAVSTAGTATLEVEEGDCIKVYSVDNGTNAGVFSDRFKEFVGANSGVIFSKSGTDSGDITLNTATGEILANLDYERPSDGDTNNVYEFTITATAGSQSISETVTLTIKDEAGVGGVADLTSTAFDAGTMGADGAILDDDDANGHATATVVALDGTIEVAAGSGGDLVLSWADLMDAAVGTAATDDHITEWITAHPVATGNHTVTVVSDGGAGDDGAGNNNVQATASAAGITFQQELAAGTYEDVQFTISDGLGEVFHLEFDLVVTDGGTATTSLTAGGTTLASQGDHKLLNVYAGGEMMEIDLKTPSSGTGNDTYFDTIGDAYTADPCGVFEMVSGTTQFNGAVVAGTASELTVTADGLLQLAEGAAAGTYSGLVKYTNNDGESTFQRIDIDSTDVGERTEASTSTSDIAIATALSPVTAAKVSSVQIRGTSTLSIDEGRQGVVTSVGTGKVLSQAFEDFKDANAGGTFTISDATADNSGDSTLFTIDSETGVVKTNGLVDYETKTSYSVTVTYTAGSSSYSEDVTINVTNDLVDDGTHIVDVDLGTQDGAATAVTILDKAINQITSSQAKLGAIQNRLQYNIDNLSKATMLTQTAKGRIMDADFAAETSELSKQQILSQAATSMLAQANQSKQSVLALLQ
jgi:flagellin